MALFEKRRKLKMKVVPTVLNHKNLLQRTKFANQTPVHLECAVKLKGKKQLFTVRGSIVDYTWLLPTQHETLQITTFAYDPNTCATKLEERKLGSIEIAAREVDQASDTEEGIEKTFQQGKSNTSKPRYHVYSNTYPLIEDTIQVQVYLEFWDAPSLQMKCVVLGDGAVGKTSFLIRNATGKFPEEYIPTIMDCSSVEVSNPSGCVELELWDTAAREAYSPIIRLTLQQADIALLCYSIVDRLSFENIFRVWVSYYLKNDRNKYLPFVLIGMKADLRDKPSMKETKSVSKEEGMKMAQQIGAAHFCEASSLENIGVREALETAASICIKRVQHHLGRKKSAKQSKCIVS